MAALGCGHCAALSARYYLTCLTYLTCLSWQLRRRTPFDYGECQPDGPARRHTRVIRNLISRPTRRPRSMSHHLDGTGASQVAAVLRQAGRYQQEPGPAAGQPVAAKPVVPAPLAAQPAAGQPVHRVQPVPSVRPSPPGRPSPSARPSPPVRPVQPAACRATIRDELDVALDGAALSARDRNFLSRLVHWDKRNAAAVVSLLRRARLAGRSEAALSPAQLETVLAALQDAVVHRVAGVDAVGCWDCENVRGGRCADHARDFERARDYAELAALLSAGAPPLTAGEVLPAADPRTRDIPLKPIQQPTDISGYRRRAPIVS
jgi:hypothetical protein